MPHEIALFWLVLAALLVVDNLVLVPAGGDHLRFGRRGRLRYDPAPRLEVRQRDLVLLNPLNPFDRIALTQRCVGRLSPAQWRASLQLVRRTLEPANRLSMLGSSYLLMLGLLGVASLKVYFGTVLLALAAAHVSSWALALWVLVRERKALRLSTARVTGLALEALLVPGYLVNLGKRVWFKHQLDLPALSVGLRELKQLPVDEDHEVRRLHLSRRIDDVALDLGLGESPAVGDTSVGPPPESTKGAGAWLEEARRCLTTSA